MPNDKTRLTCPVCGGDRFEELFPAADHSYLSPTGAVVRDYESAVRCLGCSLGIEQTLSKDPADSYTQQYDEARDHNNGSNRWRRFHHDRAVAEDRLRQLTSVVGPPNNRLWVDVGCNNGAMLVAARNAGWDAFGVEMDDEAARTIQTAVGARCGTFATWMHAAHNSAGPGFDNSVVSLFDVLEHTLDPIGVLRNAAKSVRAGNFIVIEVPDLDSAEPGTTWRHRRISADFTEHVWHFSKKSLRALFAKFLPEFEEVHCAEPVPSKLQMVWRKRERASTQPNAVGVATVADVGSYEVTIGYGTTPDVVYSSEPVMAVDLARVADDAAVQILSLPADEAPAAQAALRDTNPSFAALVQARIDRVRQQAGGA